MYNHVQETEMRTSQEGTEETYQTMAKKVVVKMNNYVQETKLRTPQDCAENYQNMVQRVVPNLHNHVQEKEMRNLIIIASKFICCCHNYHS